MSNCIELGESGLETTWKFLSTYCAVNVMFLMLVSVEDSVVGVVEVDAQLERNTESAKREVLISVIAVFLPCIKYSNSQESRHFAYKKKI